MPTDLDLWEAAITEGYATSDPNLRCFETLAIGHATFTSDILIVASSEKLVTPQGTYLPATIEPSVPDTQAASQGEAVIRVSFVPREVCNAILSASFSSDPVTIQYRQYRGANQNPAVVQRFPMELFGVVMTPDGIEGRARYADLVNRPAPWALYNATRFPGAKS